MGSLTEWISVHAIELCSALLLAPLAGAVWLLLRIEHAETLPRRTAGGPA